MKRFLSLILAFAICLIPCITVSANTIEDNVAELFDEGVLSTKQIAVRDYALGKVGTAFANGYCQAFVSYVYRDSGCGEKYYCCASKAWQMCGVSSDRSNIPIGATVYFGGSSVFDDVCDQYAGHVGIYVGNGKIVHGWGGKIVNTTIDYVINCGYPWRGWGWNGNYVLGSVESINYSSIDNGEYYINNDGYRINVVKDQQATGSLDASNTNKSKFNIIKDGNYYKLESDSSANAFVMNVWCDSYSTSGSEVTLYKNTNNGSQRWYFEECQDGYLIHPGDNTSLSLTRNTSTNKLYVNTTSNPVASNQIWKLENTGSGDEPNDDSSTSTTTYNATAAIEYGKKHWNDGVGLCAEFVSNCLKAGGSSAWNVGCTSLIGELKAENWGTLKELVVNSNGTISLEKNKNVLSPGDPIFVYSEGCLSVDGKPYVHVYLYYDTDSNGNLKGYAHNNASNGVIDVYFTCAYCGKPTDSAYVYHMTANADESEIPDKEQTLTDAPINADEWPGWSTTKPSGEYEIKEVYVYYHHLVTFSSGNKGAYPINKSQLASNGISCVSEEEHPPYWSETPLSKKSSTLKYTLNGELKIFDEYTNECCSGNYNFSTNANSLYYSGKQTIYRKIEEYTVTYNANGGVGAPANQTKVYGTDLTLSSTVPTKSGYTFKGWSTSVNGSVAYAAGATYSANSAVTLYAIWELNNISVTGITLNKTSTTMNVGASETLTATVVPNNATNKTVTWTSSNPNIASVSNGVITAKSAGTATITVKTADGNKTATCTVTVKTPTVAVTGVSLNKTATTLTVGGTETLIATVTPSNATDKTVTWTSSNPNIASVSNGVVTAKAAGTTTITATTIDGKYSSSCGVKVETEQTDKPTISISDTKGFVGNTVTVPILITNNPGIVSMTLEMAYDTNVFTLVGVNDTELLVGTMHSDVYTSPYTLTWENDTSRVNFDVTGKLVELVFEIDESASTGTYEFNLSYPKDGIYNLDGTNVEFVMDSGSCQISDYLLGDVNGDGEVTNKDRLMLSRHLAKWEGYEIDKLVFDAADINGDGEITNRDRLLLSRHLAKWDGYENLYDL